MVIILSIFIITPVIAENLVSFYRFDESTGTIACDSTGNGHTGTVSGIGVVWSPAGGYHDGAVYFDATITGSKNGAVQVPTAGISNSAGAITFWAKLANPQSRSYRNGYGYFFGTGGGNAAYLMLYMDNYDTQLDLKIGGTIVENIINLNTNSWFHVAIVWNGTTYVQRQL